MSLLKAENIQVELGKRTVLKGASLEVQKGQVVGLIGPNGAGKSTLIKAISGLIPREQGDVQVHGKSIETTSRQELAKTLAYLPQGREIHWPLSVERVVALGRLPHLQPWQKIGPEDHKAIEESMKQSDVLHLADRCVDELAGGEKALVMIARVLANQPDLLLADEPVAGLDPNHQIQVMQLLKSYARQDRGIVVVLHDLSLAARFCDQLFLIHEGKILDSGEPKKVLSEDNLKTSYGIEAQFGEVEDGFFVIPVKRMSS